MVKRAVYLILAGFFVSPLAYSEGQETYEEFRQRVQAAQQKIDYSQQLLKLDELHNYIPSTEEEAPQGKSDPVSAPVEAGSQNTGEDHPSQAVGAPKHAAAVSQGPSQVDEDNPPVQKEPGYRPPSTPARRRSAANDAYIDPSLRQASAGNAVRNKALIDQPEAKTIIFGIRIGSEINVELLGGLPMSRMD